MKITQIFNRTALLSLAISSAILMSGCASTGSNMASTSADPRLTNNESAKFFSKSGYQACAVGAGVGVLACLASNTNNKAGCAVAAGITACGVAMGANYYLDDRRTQYADTTERLQVITKDIQYDSERVAQRTQVAQLVIVDSKAQMEQIQKDIASKRLDVAKANKDLAGIDSSIVLLNKELKNMQDKATEYAKVAQKERADGAGDKVQVMEQEITIMNQRVAILKTEVDELYNQRSAITLG